MTLPKTPLVPTQLHDMLKHRGSSLGKVVYKEVPGVGVITLVCACNPE